MDVRSVATQGGATWRMEPDARGKLWHVQHPAGLACWLYIPDAPPEPYCYSLAWYVPRDCTRRLSVSFSNVIKGHQRRANWRCFGGEAALQMLAHGLKHVADGSAFEPDHRSLINPNCGV